MELLRIEYKNINLFTEGFIFDLTATNKIVDFDQVKKISTTINLQKIIALAGVNATGKTTAIRMINFAIELLNNNTALEKITSLKSLLKENSEIIIDFTVESVMYRLDSIIGVEKGIEENLSTTNIYFFKEETLLSKSLKNIKTKKDIYNWKDFEEKTNREDLNIDSLNLLNKNHSIAILKTKGHIIPKISLLEQANLNICSFDKKIDSKLINLFDNSIEYINPDNDEIISIKFKNKNKELKIKNFSFEEFQLLSSGTIKGAILISAIKRVFNFGGILLIDELEIHLNKTIVEKIIDLFSDPSVNSKGAILIFSTHYLEILDSINRKDAIFVFQKTKNFGMSVIRYSDRIKRNDITKSKVLLSNYFRNTAPSYESMEKLKESLCNKRN